MPRRLLAPAAVAAAGLLGASLAAGPAAAETLLVAPHAVMPDGSLRDDVAVVIGDDGVIDRVLDADEVAGRDDVRRLPEGSVLSPGLIDLASFAGVWQANASTGDSIDPTPSVVDAFDPGAPGVRAALEAGITALMLAPSMNGLVDGACATVRTAPGRDGSHVLNPECALAMTMGEPAFGTALGPFSRGGAMPLLRRTLSEAEDRGAADTRLGRVVRGELPVVALVSEPEDASAMLRLLGRHDVVPTLVHTVDAIDVAGEVGDRGAAMIVGPYAVDAERRVLAGAAALHEAGATVAFRSGLPGTGADRLRMTAALAVRHGLGPEAARRGLTAAAAEIAGVADRVGAIEPGRHADLVVFSGDPLRLDSRVLEVHVDGRVAHRHPTTGVGHAGHAHGAEHHGHHDHHGAAAADAG